MPEHDDDKGAASPKLTDSAAPSTSVTDPNADVKELVGSLRSLIERHVAVTDSRSNEQAVRMDARDRADAEFRGHMKGAMNTLQERVSTIEGQLPKVQQEARAAMQSHDDLHRYVHSTYDEQHAAVMARLAEQDAERDRIEVEKREMRARESMAAKKLADDRAHKENRQKIWAPVIQAIAIALVTAAGAYLAATVAASNTEAKVDAVNRKIDSHGAAIEETRNVVLKEAAAVAPAPAAALPAPSPPPPAKK